jgi:putative transposase
LDKSYQKFFAKQGGRPSFKKVKQYRSFTLKQSGWKLLEGNKVQLLGRTYKFVKHREIGGTIKTVTVKRDRVNRLWIAFSVIENIHIPKASTGKIGGFDFGLKTFLTDDEGRPTTSPQYFKQGLKQIAERNRNLARKEKGSRNRRRAKRQLGMAHEHIANKRRDHHFQLAHNLCDEYDMLIFEDLNLKGLHMMWGRKVSDLGFRQFTEIVQYVAIIRGKTVRFIDRWEPTSRTCSRCQHQQTMALRDRDFDFQVCGLILDRDHNAARNIKRVGISTLGLEAVRRSDERNLA